jgi:hypothetical protein
MDGIKEIGDELIEFPPIADLTGMGPGVPRLWIIPGFPDLFFGNGVSGQVLHN